MLHRLAARRIGDAERLAGARAAAIARQQIEIGFEDELQPDKLIAGRGIVFLGIVVTRCREQDRDRLRESVARAAIARGRERRGINALRL
jgi:hypothetical protein